MIKFSVEKPSHEKEIICKILRILESITMDPEIFQCFANNERASRAVTRVLTKQYDADSWTLLVKEASGKPIDDVEKFYEALVKTFPTCGRFWRIYIDHELKYKRYEKVSELFQRSLDEVLSIDLYKSYLNYVRGVKASEPDLIYKAYRYTLDKVGNDPNAISIYNDYIQFLKERDVDGSYLESQKITAVRKAYIEGVLNPMFHIDSLWKEYINYEQSINPLIAEKAVQERSRDYMNARRVAKEWEVTIRGLNRSMPATPPAFSQDEQRQAEIWRRYVTWEKSNPTRTETNSITIKRISYAYKQYLLCFGHHPHVWHEYASFLDEQIKSLNDREIDLKKKLAIEMMTLFERAIKGFMKYNLLIHFAYADFEEIRNDRKKAREIYDNLIATGKTNNQIDLTLVYIKLMSFVRRTEGSKSARIIFKEARDETKCTHHIYTAHALMEYHSTKDQTIACKIFEIGLKKPHIICADYILSYIHFMNSLNEENNTRVLFERVLTTYNLDPKDTVEIWNCFLEFESGIGDLSSINRVERRRTAALEQLFPKCSEASWSVCKYKFQDLFPCSVNELKSMNYDPIQSATSSKKLREILNSLDNSITAVTNQQVANANPSNVRNGSNANRNGNRNTNANGSEFADLMAEADIDFPMTALNQKNMCLPDFDQMIPFKPVMAPGFGAHTVPGGIFAPPPAVANLLSRLPQAASFWGPFVDVEEVCNILRTSDFDELFNNLVRERRENKPRMKKQRVE